MLEHLRHGDNRFGVVMIERGSEVGGGDVRSRVGTIAELVEAQPIGDGRWAAMAVGRERFRVVRWLDDDPYPRAEVDLWPDESPAPVFGVDPVAGQIRELTISAVRLLMELNGVVEAEMPAIEFPDDSAALAFTAVRVAMLGPLDQFAVLCAPGAAERLQLVQQLLIDHVDLLEARIALGGP